MNKYMENIAKILGVELGEIFSIKHEGVVYNSRFTLTEFGLMEISKGIDCEVTISIDSLLNGDDEIVKHWKPNNEEYYYVPTLTFYPSGRYEVYMWDGGDFDQFWLNHGLVCKTKEEAIELAGKMLTFTKNTQEGKNNG